MQKTLHMYLAPKGTERDGSDNSETSLEKPCLGIRVCLHVVYPLEGLQSLLGLLCLAPGALCCLCLVLLLLGLHMTKQASSMRLSSLIQQSPPILKIPAMLRMHCFCFG